MEELQKKIRPLYRELKGYLQVVPDEPTIFDRAAVDLSTQLNGVIDELNIATEQNFDKFKVHPYSENWNRVSRTVVKSLEYRNKLSGLINRLQGEFFPEELTIINQPNTIVNANQSQSQYQSLTVILDLQERILSEIPKHTEGTKERNFLEKFKSALPTIKTMTDILSSALKIGAEMNLDPATIHKILGF